MAGKIFNNIKYIALMDDISIKQLSFNDCILCYLRDVFYNCDSESDTEKVNKLLLILKKNNDEFIIDDNVYKKIYGFLNSLKDNSFYFEKVESFDEIKKDEYIEFNIWWEQLQELIKKLEIIIINMQK